MATPGQPRETESALANPWTEAGAQPERALRVVPDERTPPPSAAERTQARPQRAGPAAGPLGLVLVNAPEPGTIGAFIPVGERDLVIGRSGEADIRVEDPGISRLHLRVTRRDDGRHVAEDLGSRNGTYLNGAAIRSATLADGDRLQFGTCTEFLFGRVRPEMEETIRLRQALGAAGAGAWEWTAPSGRLTFSGGLARSLRRSAEVAEPQDDDWKRILPEDRDRVRARMRGALERGEPVELECRLLREDGAIAWIAMKGQAFRDHTGVQVRVAGTAMDVTERKRAESESGRQALLLDSLSDGIVVVGRDGAVVDWNSGAERLFGWTKQEAQGRRPGALLHPDRVDTLSERLVALARGPRQPSEELLLRHRNGGTAQVELAAVPLLSEAGEAVATVAVFRDVGERRRLEARLQLSERLASLGMLAAGLAHEINNPLCFVIANLQYVAEQVLHGPARAGGCRELEAAVADSLAGAARIRAIVNDLRQYGDARAAPSDGADVDEVIEFSLRIAAARLLERAMVRKAVAAVPPVRGDRTRLGQVLLNLLVNAADAIPPGRAGENEVAVVARYDPEANRVIIEVLDTGVGIAPEDAPHVFDPFFTTKPVGVGTGLGLSVCHGLVTGMGGEITFEPGPGGRGTTFRLSLLPEDAATAARPASGPGAGEAPPAA